MKYSKYLGLEMAGKGTMKTEVSHKVGEGMKVLGELRNVLKAKLLLERSKIC